MCSGYDALKYDDVWSSCPFGETDNNPYREYRFTETFRSLRCSLLVKSNRWRCCECDKMAALFGEEQMQLQKRCARNSQQTSSLMKVRK